MFPFSLCREGEGNYSLQRWQSGGCHCLGSWLCTGALSNSVLTHTQLLGSPEKSSFAYGLPRKFAAEPLFRNCSERHHATFRVLCPAEGLDRQVVGHYQASYSAHLHLRTSRSVGAPFPSFCYLSEEGVNLSKEESQRWDFYRKPGNLKLLWVVDSGLIKY